MTFYVGQKVVCVDDSVRVRWKIPANRWIKEGHVYVVRAFGECPYKPWRTYGPAIWLEGIVRTGDPKWPDFPFEATRFRPAVERITDISVFTKMLTPNLERVES